MKTNAFPEEVIADHEEEEYKNNLQGPLESLSQIWHVQGPYSVNVVSDGCPFHQLSQTYLL